jgi:RNA polymerase sigma-70 factor (ECF subfamily)
VTRDAILVSVDQAGTGEQAHARLARARQGDEEAFRFVYRALSPELLRYAAVLPGQDAGDVMAVTELPDADHTWTSGASHSRDVAEILGARIAEREAVTRIARLPRAQAEAVLLRVVLDMDNRSAAEVSGRPPGAVAAAMSRGPRRLARMAWEDGYGEEVRTRCGTGTSTRRNSGA